MKKTQLGSGRLLIPLLVSALACCLLAPTKSHAALKTWTTVNAGDASGSWTVGANWGGTAPATGDDVDFSTLDVQVDSTITLTGKTTCNSMVFGDTDVTTPAGWLVTGNSMVVTSGNITVNALGTGKAVTFNSRKVGIGISPNPMTKMGPGLLAITASCSTTVANVQNGTLLLSSGDPTIAGGTVVLGNGATSGKLVIGDPGGVLGFPGVAKSQSFISMTVSGTGTSNAVVGGNSALSTLAIANASGENIFSGVIGGPGVNENNLNLTKSAAGTLTLTSSNTYSGTTTLSAGQLNINYGGDSSLDSAIGTGILTISAGSIDNTSGSPVTLLPNNPQNWNGSFTFVGSSTLNLGTGAVALAANRTVTVTANNLIVGGAITGAGGLTKAGAGTLTLQAANGYAGNTTVTAGTLALTSAGAVTSPTIAVNGGILDVTGIGGTLTLAGGQTLRGAGGSVNGNVIVPTGAGIAAGTGAAIGTLTINGNLTLQSGSTTTLKLSEGVGSDLITVGANNIVYGGTLTVTNLGAAQVGGEVYQLFSAAHYSGTFDGGVNLPTLADGLSWVNTLLSNGSISVSNGVAPPVTNAPVVITNITKLTSAGFGFSFMGTLGSNYTIWASTNPGLTPVESTWTPISSNTFSGGLDQFTDTNAVNVPHQFYIISTP